MYQKLILIAAFCVFTNWSFGQVNESWDQWSWLIGEWIGEGSGKPGEGGGTFTFSFGLDKKVIIRKSHSEYPAKDQKPKVVHDDLMIIYLDNNSPTQAIYFDNEGHVINYRITYENKSIILVSTKTENTPIFRLSYSLLDNSTINTKFELSQDGEKFMTYIEGRSKKIK